MLDTEFKYYVENQKQLVEKYNGRFIVIVGENVVGDYETFDEALSEAQKKFEAGKFLIQQCIPGKEAFTQTFHTRVVFH